jgi:hypothetical protein
MMPKTLNNPGAVIRDCIPSAATVVVQEDKCDACLECSCDPCSCPCECHKEGSNDSVG